MSKEPAFLFYDGDAARDVSHMNRLERGCYFDLLQAQRKFGGYTVEQARKILGKDFDKCWGAIELVLSVEKSKNVENDKYYIEWIKESTNKRKEYAETQRSRIQNYWDNKKKETLPRKYRGTSTEVPFENENENNKEGGMGEEKITRKDRSKKYLPLAEYLSKIIQTNKNIKHTSQQLNSWAYSICQLEEIDGISFERIETALKWYEKNIGGEYVVEIESGKSLRDKFIRLENATKRKAIGRNGNKPKFIKDPNQGRFDLADDGYYYHCTSGDRYSE